MVLVLTLGALVESEFSARGVSGLLLPLAGASYCALQCYYNYDVPHRLAGERVADEAWDRYVYICMCVCV